ncbi:unnamed protein product [Larinioides sclopetarius]|uniref:Uncharacterized protein n=1 Tax=Larinioides sclopetarius TaxID=280406 RepID=A0AAV1Z3Y0_9ARAC
MVNKEKSSLNFPPSPWFSTRRMNSGPICKNLTSILRLLDGQDLGGLSEAAIRETSILTSEQTHYHPLPSDSRPHTEILLPLRASSRNTHHSKTRMRHRQCSSKHLK